MNVCEVGMGCYLFGAATKPGRAARESRVQTWLRLEMKCVRCYISSGVMRSLGVWHGYLLRVVGNLGQGRWLYAINGFGILPSTTLLRTSTIRHIYLYTVRNGQREFLSSAVSPSGGIVTDAFLLVTTWKISRSHPRHGSYPHSHIATRPTPVARPSISVRDTQRRFPHVVVPLVVVAYAPNGSSGPLHSRHDTPVTW